MRTNRIETNFATCLAASALALAALAACHAPNQGGRDAGEQRLGAGGEAPPPPPPAALPWTRRFTQEAVLFGDEIHIEGPAGLMDHLVLRQEPDAEYKVETLPRGLSQSLVVNKPGAVELRGHLDAWTLVAFRRITVLERPFPGPIRVTATGHAAWVTPGGEERRQARLEFSAELDE